VDQDGADAGPKSDLRGRRTAGAPRPADVPERPASVRAVERARGLDRAAI